VVQAVCLEGWMYALGKLGKWRAEANAIGIESQRFLGPLTAPKLVFYVKLAALTDAGK